MSQVTPSLGNSPESLNKSKTSLRRSIDRYKKLMMFSILSLPGLVGAQNPNSISQSPRLQSTEHRDTIDASAYSPSISHDIHTEQQSDSLQAHMVLSEEILSRALLLDGTPASDGAVLSSEVDIYAQKGDLSAHLMVHDISPLNSTDQLESELATSVTGKYDHGLVHVAAGFRNNSHTGMHPHKHIHDDGHGHKTVEVTERLTRERYLAALFQVGLDIGDHVTVFSGGEFKLGWADKNLLFAGVDGHAHIHDWHVAGRVMVVNAFGKDTANFIRPSIHLEHPIMKEFFKSKLYATFFAEWILPLDDKRDNVGVVGFGVRARF